MKNCIYLVSVIIFFQCTFLYSGTLCHPAAVRSKVVVLLFIVTPIVGVYKCSMFFVRYFMSILVLQSF